MIPITELRAAIPWAILVQELPWHKAVLFSIAGNFIITIPILICFDPAVRYFRKWKIFDDFFVWLFARTRRKSRLIDRFEFWGLVLFVGTPLPMTGVWTGCVAAFLVGFSNMKALLAMLIGLCISAAIVTTLTLTGYMIIQ